MSMIRKFSTFLVIVLLAGVLIGCTATTPGGGSVPGDNAALSSDTPADSTASAATPAASALSDSTDAATTTAVDPASPSHGKDADPNYDVVFPQGSVNRIDVTLSPEAWTALQTEMVEQFGEPGTGGGMGGFGGPGERPSGEMPDFPEPPQDGQQPPGDFPGEPLEGGRPGGGVPGGIPGGGIGGMDFADTTYVPSTITFNGETWDSVGFRYSGNSTLQTSWRNGTKKISFRLDFDEFEDDVPATKDQRFYGFKQLSFKSNALDESYLREKAAGDIFREAGVTSSQTAFYEVYVDYGEGPQYFGLYTAVEIVDDTLIETAFDDDNGNVYKPEGTGATFVEGTFDEESFEKQTNEDEADWSDIQALFAALNADTRTTDPAAWRAGLEAVFDVDAFLRWLAVDTIMQNWDTYGAMSHNYYLYNDPSDGLLTWIPWDNNMSLSGSMGEGGRSMGESEDGDIVVRGGPGNRGARPLDLSTITNQWPLIRFLSEDPVYMAQYEQYLQETIDGAFQPETLEARFQGYYDLIAPYVERETEDATQLDSFQQFEQSLGTLIQHVHDRYDAVVAYLAES